MRGRHLAPPRPHWMWTETPSHDRLGPSEYTASSLWAATAPWIVCTASALRRFEELVPLQCSDLPTTPGQRHECSRVRLAARRGLHLPPPGAVLPDRHCRTGPGPAGAGTTDLPQLSGTARVPGMGDRCRRRSWHLGWTQRAGTAEPPAPAALGQAPRNGPEGGGARDCLDRADSITSTHRERSERLATSPAPHRGTRTHQAVIVTAGSVVPGRLTRHDHRDSAGPRKTTAMTSAGTGPRRPPTPTCGRGSAEAWVLGTGSYRQRWRR